MLLELYDLRCFDIVFLLLNLAPIYSNSSRLLSIIGSSVCREACKKNKVPPQIQGNTGWIIDTQMVISQVLKYSFTKRLYLNNTCRCVLLKRCYTDRKYAKLPKKTSCNLQPIHYLPMGLISPPWPASVSIRAHFQSKHCAFQQNSEKCLIILHFTSTRLQLSWQDTSAWSHV